MAVAAIRVRLAYDFCRSRFLVGENRDLLFEGVQEIKASMVMGGGIYKSP